MIWGAVFKIIRPSQKVKEVLLLLMVDRLGNLPLYVCINFVLMTKVEEKKKNIQKTI